MEFLRFGSSIPGSYWGCCAVCIIQNFNCDPEAPASIELVDGDSGTPVGDEWLGKTNREVFDSRIRIGTFSDSEMPNHGFLAVLTENQIKSTYGKMWLEILKETGFEFIRTIDNSVYSGDEVPLEKDPDYDSDNKNYLFGMFRNIGDGAVLDPLTPPQEWTEIDGGCLQAVDFLTEKQKKSIADSQETYHRKVWDSTELKIFSRQELEESDIPLTFAGQRSKFPQQGKTAREAALAAQSKTAVPTPAPFG